MTQTDQTIRIPETVLFQEVEGQSVLLDLASEQYYGLDEVGTRCWRLLCDGLDLDQVRERLLAEYAVSAEQLDADLDALIAELSAAGLVIRGD